MHCFVDPNVEPVLELLPTVLAAETPLPPRVVVRALRVVVRTLWFVVRALRFVGCLCMLVEVLLSPEDLETMVTRTHERWLETDRSFLHS